MSFWVILGHTIVILDALHCDLIGSYFFRLKMLSSRRSQSFRLGRCESGESIVSQEHQVLVWSIR